MTGIVAGVGAKAVLSAAGARLGQISPRTWLIIGCAVALVLGVLWHRHEVKVTIAAAYAQGKNDEAAHVLQAAQKIKANADALNSKISTAERKANDEENSRIAADAGSIRVSGPGKAICPGSPRLPATPGGLVAPSAAPDAAGPSLPADDIAAVSWPWLVDRAQEHDELRSEVQAWRDWYAQVQKAWPKGPK